MSKTVLIGNGVNRLEHPGSWQDVLNNLALHIGRPDLMDNVTHKPFTLLYEEIALLSGARAKGDELKIKKVVAEGVSHIPFNDCHRQLVEAAPLHIITTNYDYNLERASGPNQKANVHPEKRYNVFRRQCVAEKFIWHIHGEANVPDSITLGHEQYAGQLQMMRSYVTANRNSKAKRKSPFKLHNYQFEQDDVLYSWVDVFLRDDVHIAGLGLDYTEMDLWWLLAYKARMRQISGYPVGRTAYYSCPPEQRDAERYAAKSSILRSLGVEVHDRIPSQREVYDQVLSALGAP